MYPNDRHQTFGVWSVHDDRDLSRAAAERHHLMQAVAEQQQTAPRRSRLHRLLTAAVPAAVRPGGAEA